MDFSFIEDKDLRAKAEEGNKAELKELNENITTKVEEAIVGLKSKNGELLGEKKTIQGFHTPFPAAFSTRRRLCFLLPHPLNHL